MRNQIETAPFCARLHTPDVSDSKGSLLGRAGSHWGGGRTTQSREYHSYPQFAHHRPVGPGCPLPPRPHSPLRPHTPPPAPPPSTSPYPPLGSRSPSASLTPLAGQSHAQPFFWHPSIFDIGTPAFPCLTTVFLLFIGSIVFLDMHLHGAR